MKNNEHYEQLWKSYEELEDRMWEIFDLIDEILGTKYELSVYEREMDFYEDNIICGQYKFPFKWLSFEDEEVVKALNAQKNRRLEKEKALQERELAELKRLKDKYENNSNTANKSCETCKWDGSWDIRCSYCEDFEHYERSK